MSESTVAAKAVSYITFRIVNEARQESAMSYGPLVAERAILAVDRFLSGVMTYVWTSTLSHQQTTRKPVSSHRQQPPPEEDYGGGDICSLQETVSTEDDQPLD